MLFLPLMLVQMLGQYYERIIQLTAMAASPETPEPVKKIALKVAAAAGEMVDRTIRTFDQVRDPASFIIEVEDELAGVAAGAPDDAISQMMNMISGGGDNGGAGLPQITEGGGM